jgi:hypothetical protein
MPLIVTARVFGAEVLSKQLGRGKQKAVNMKSGLDEVADDMLRIFGINITSGGRRGGGSFAALDPKYVASKVSSGYSAKPLIATRDLLTSVSKRGAEYQHLEVDAKSILFASTLPYAEIQQHGGRGIKPRDYLKILPTDIKRWGNLLEDDWRKAFD